MASEPIYKPTIIDNLYLFSIIIGFVCINLASANVLYIISPILIASVYLDWRSARVAENTKITFFLFSDLITNFNYIGIFIAFTLAPNPILGYSSRIWLHWGLIFVIYIFWNILMMRMPKIEKSSYRFFLFFNVLEIPLAIICLALFIESINPFLLNLTNLNLLKHPKIPLIIIGILHAVILISWFIKTYFKKDNS